ncbi:MAG: 3-beta hydroxysteroid dehydrogenase [Zetaproteobacteria bacterium]|nr:3-beta hydroxysteroid dehydrogenase [Pseudobdellovibrionaceae bacterium]
MKPKHILVTGGGGFLGKEICKQLVERGYQVSSFSRKTYFELEKMGIKSFQGNLCNYESILPALSKCDSIIHTASLAGIWGDKQQYYQTNIIGTRNLLIAARESSIKRFIYTSSPSVVFEDKDIKGSDESISYSKKFTCTYPYTKKEAEKEVLQSSDINSYVSVALRPHLIWGPGDPHFLPRLLSQSKAKKIRRVGNGKNLVDIIHVKNAAYAHVLALENILENKNMHGKAYFLGQERPVNLWDFLNQLLSCYNEKQITKKIPFPFAYTMGYLLEKIYKIFNWVNKEPPMTKFLALQMSKSHYFSHENAKKDFSYKPIISIEEGLEELKKLCC